MTRSWSFAIRSLILRPRYCYLGASRHIIEGKSYDDFFEKGGSATFFSPGDPAAGWESPPWELQDYAPSSFCKQYIQSCYCASAGVDVLGDIAYLI